MKRLWAELTRALGWLFPAGGDSDGEAVADGLNRAFGEGEWGWLDADDIDGDAEEVWTDWLGFESDDD